MQKNKSGFTWFYNFILFDDATADAKTRLDHIRKSQITVIIQASWQINILIFKYSIL